MADDIIKLAKAVACDLGKGQFSVPFLPEFALDATRDLRDLATLDVIVRPAGLTDSPAARTILAEDYAVEVCIRKRVGGDLDLVASELVGLGTEIRRYWFKHRVPTGCSASWKGSQTIVDYEAAELKTKRVLKASVIILFGGWFDADADT